MKLWLTIVSIGTLAFFAGAGVTYNVHRDDNTDQKLLIVMRKIGHDILVKAGDPTSRVLPVKTIDIKTFQLQFENPFAFEPDTLVNVIHSNIASSNLPSQYMVNVTTCQGNEVVYAYQIINSMQNSIIPCLGRGQPTACYLINITFTGTDMAFISTVTNIKFLSIVAIVFLSFLGTSYIRNRNKNGPLDKNPPVTIGKYSFCFGKQTLTKGRKSTKLSTKETRLLKVFADNQNKLLDRRRLLKEVWEDDGVFVGRSLDVFVSKLRKKLSDDTSIKLINVHGKGYKLEVNHIFRGIRRG